MSTSRAAAAVTAVLTERIGDAIRGLLQSAEVKNRRPGVAVGLIEPPHVNVFLYRAVPNASLRNAADPVRSQTGRLVKRPVAAWDLQYLITCIGAEEQLEPELLFGAMVTGLTTDPVLTREFVISLNDTFANEPGNRSLAANSGLETQVVRLTPIDLSVEALTQLWSSLTSEPYALSIAYQASVVLMSPDLSPAPPLPVAGGPSLALSRLNAPHLSSVVDSEGANRPILINSTLVLEGQRFRTENTQVRLGKLDVDVPVDGVSDHRIELALSPEGDGGVRRPLDLAPGVLAVQVRHRVDVSTHPGAPEWRPAVASNVLPIVLRPAIVGAPVLDVDGEGDRVIAITLAPDASPDWEYGLFLNELGVEAPRGLVLDPSSFDLRAHPPRVLFKSADVPTGAWLVRIQVNGAESPLVRDANGVFSEPRVTTP